MVVAIFNKHFRDLLESCDTKIPNHTTMQRVWIVKINHLAHKIGTVSFDEVIALEIWLAIEFADQQCILFRTGLNFKSINCPVICGPNQFIPVSLWCSTIREIGGKCFQVVATISISKKGDQF